MPDTDIVRYDNVMNDLCFSGFSGKDFDLLMCLCSRMAGCCDQEQVYDYDELMDAVNWDRHQSIDLFHFEVKRMVERLRKVGGVFDVDSDEFLVFNLFSTFRGNRRKKKLTVRVNPDFVYILNDLTKCFTSFELREYVSLDGRYAKQLYQQLKQYKNTGWWQVSVDDIRRRLSIPVCYKNMHIMSKVINPSMEMLRQCQGFSGLSVEVIRSSGRGRGVSAYRFFWELPKVQSAENKKTNTRKTKNRFNDFPQHQYSAEEWEELEKELCSN